MKAGSLDSFVNPLAPILNLPQDHITDPAQGALSEADVREVAALLEAAGGIGPDLWPVLTEPSSDSLIDQVFKDEVHAPRT